MPDRWLSFRVRGLEPLKQYLDELPRKLRGFVTEETANILVEDYLQPYPPYKYVTRKAAYGQTFVSDKQRRFVMAMIAQGKIDPGAPHRTGQLQNAWKVTGDGVKAKITVDAAKAPHAQYVVGQNQAAQPYHVGWQKAKYVIDANLSAATQKAQAAVDAWLKSEGKL